MNPTDFSDPLCCFCHRADMWFWVLDGTQDKFCEPLCFGLLRKMLLSHSFFCLLPHNIIFLLLAGEYPQQAEHGKCRWVQLCPLVRVFPAQESHVPCVWDAGAEPLRLPEAQQVQPSDAQVHPANPAAGRHRANEAEEPGADPCRPEAWKHHAGRPSEAAIQGEGHWFRLGEPCFQSCMLNLPAVSILQVSIFA